MLSGRSTDETGLLIETLIRDVVRHFKDQEAIIANTNFPEAEGHAAIHQELVSRAVELAGQFHAGTLSLGDLFQFLAQDVVAKHMLGADREFFPYLQNYHEQS